MDETEWNGISEAAIRAAIEVHRALGSGGLESADGECLCRELDLRHVHFRRQVEIPIVYKGVKLACGYRMDFRIEEARVVELKAVEKIMPVHEAQVLAYWRVGGHRLGLILDFNVPALRHEIRRIVNNL